MKHLLCKKFTLFTFMLALMVALSSCGGGDSGKTEGAGTKDSVPAAANDSDKTPAVNGDSSAGDNSLAAEVNAKATGNFVQTKDGAAYATLNFKYIEGTESEFTLSSADGKSKISGKAVNYDDTFVYTACDIVFSWDGNQFNVSSEKTDCKGNKTDFNGTYTRK